MMWIGRSGSPGGAVLGVLPFVVGGDGGGEVDWRGELRAVGEGLMIRGSPRSFWWDANWAVSLLAG
jgi:hypothetical protein